jgi:hypothetical protein
MRCKESKMKYLGTVAFVAALALATSASAAVVCNDEGDCWKVKDKHTYPPEARITVYDDNYVLGPKYRWREPGAGRGYWRGGVWIGF